MVRFPRRWFLIGCLLVVGAGAGVWWWRREPAPIPSRGGRNLEVLVPGVPFFRQGDPRWGDERLGGSGEPLAAAGCTVTCVAMALAQAGTATDPGDLHRRLLARKGYTATGLLDWRALAVCYDPPPTVSFPGPDHATIDACLGTGYPLIARIRLGSDGTGPIHWVLLVGKRGEDYLAYDPLLATGPIVLAHRTPRIEALRLVRR